MNNIAAVVVTYNRLALLQQCIASLNNQALRLNAIIVVNNGSTDGTADWLTNQQGLQVIHQSNLGGAGGFYAGIKAAYESGFDWIWIMDDDAFPQSDCLKCLKQAQETLNDNAIVLAPTVVENDVIDELHRGFIDPSNLKQPLQHTLSRADYAVNEKVPLKISFTSFIGMLISREIVKTVGYPEPSYYIFHDDVEYSIRIHQKGFSSYLVKEAIVYHKHTKSGTFKVKAFAGKPSSHLTALKPRISDLWRNRYADMEQGEVLKFIGKRNWLRTVVKHYGVSPALLYILFKKMVNVLGYTLFSKKNNRLTLSLYALALKQGVSGKFNNDSFFALREKIRKG